MPPAADAVTIEEAVTIEAVAPDSSPATRVLRAYMDDVASRYYGRQATAAEIDDALAEDPSDGLAPPDGVLLVARVPGVVLGCAGLRVLPDGIGEVQRVFVAHAARGRGLGTRLLGAVEAWAAERGLATVRLDTRHDLVEARRLYGALGYEEVPAFNDGRYADHWFAKALSS